ncbi:MAG: site-2 protease family protein [Cyclobacteriaceae bacterium]|nr:site-2 protease family protein [Cyclobacteriaceae bacterium]
MKHSFKEYLLHGGLFIVTFITTTMAGAEWTNGKSILAESYSWEDFSSGLPYSICFLMILTAHEFGHYFVAVYYRVRTTLPFYIPLPPVSLMLGTLGAMIRIKSPIRSTKENFDIGVAGPLAGFVVSVGFLMYGFTHLPPPEYIFQFHPEYEQYGLEYASDVYTSQFMPAGSVDVIIGKNLLFIFFENVLADPVRLPNVHEIIHYPFLFAGFLSLIFTSINLLPIGQLDGGHVLYGLVGRKKHRIIASIIFIAFLFYAGIGFISPFEPLDKLVYEIPLFVGFLFFALKGMGLDTRDNVLAALAIFTAQYLVATLFPHAQGYSGWLLFAFIIGRFIGIQHPPCEIEEPLSSERVVIGWVALVIFVLCFTPQPIQLIEHVTVQP